jgi:hypothetical protein
MCQPFLLTGFGLLLQVGSVMVARDGIEPPTPAFQGRLAMKLIGLESADIIEMITLWRD